MRSLPNNFSEHVFRSFHVIFSAGVFACVFVLDLASAFAFASSSASALLPPLL